MKKPLPVGVDNFEKIITEDYYYVDKRLSSVCSYYRLPSRVEREYFCRSESPEQHYDIGQAIQRTFWIYRKRSKRCYEILWSRRAFSRKYCEVRYGGEAK